MRSLATIRRISKLLPIEGADRIEIAELSGLGWQVVVGKNEFKVGDVVVYFEIDSAIPVGRDVFEFLKDRCHRQWKSGATLLGECYRIKTAKLRGVVSQGLVIGIDKFPELSGSFELDDVSAKLGVEHYDDLSEKYAGLTGFRSADAVGSFPSAVPKTDEERIQNLSALFDSAQEIDYEATEKADGTSITAMYAPSIDAEDPFILCSRNLRIKFDPTAPRNAPLVHLPDAMRVRYESSGEELAIQGELVGPGINGNRDEYKEYHWKVFRIFDIKSGQFVGPEVRYVICDELDLEHVKVLRKHWKVFQDLPTLKDMLAWVEGKTDNGHEREGVVFKPYNQGPRSFKCISNKYLLAEK